MNPAVILEDLRLKFLLPHIVDTLPLCDLYTHVQGLYDSLAYISNFQLVCVHTQFSKDNCET